jgi:hypothetical protein
MIDTSGVDARLPLSAAGNASFGRVALPEGF